MADLLNGVKNRLILPMLLGSCLMVSGLQAAPVAVTSYVQQPDGVLFTMATGQMSLKACSGSIIRRSTPPSPFFQPGKASWYPDTFPTVPSLDHGHEATNG